MIKGLLHKLASTFFLFAVALLVSLLAVVLVDMSALMGSLDSAQQLSAVQKIAYDTHRQDIVDDMILVSLLIMVAGLVVFMFYSRALISPLKSISQAMAGLVKGDSGIRLDYSSSDEIGNTVRAFNDVSRGFERQRLVADRYRAILDMSPVPTVLLNHNFTVVEATAGFIRSFGYTEQQVKGNMIYEFMDESSAKRLRRLMVDRKDSEGYTALSVNIVSRDEGIVPVNMELSFMSGFGDDVAVVGFLRDMRGQAVLEDALKIERETAETIMDSTGDMVLIVDRNYIVVSANMALRVNRGRDIAGETCHSALHGHDERCYLRGDICSIREVLETNKPFRTTVRNELLDDKESFFDVLSFPLRDSSGEVSQVFMSMRNVTDRVRYEQDIGRKNHELTALNEISRRLSRSLRGEDAYDDVLDRVCELFGMDGGGVYLFDDIGRMLRCEHSRGLSPDFLKNIDAFKPGEDVPGRVALEGVAAFVSDMSSDTRTETSAFRHTGIKGFACVPVRGSEKLLGVLFVFSFSLRTFSEGDEGILDSVSEIMGIAIENAHLYRKMRSIYAQDRQRRLDEQKGLMRLSSKLTSSYDIGAVMGPSLDMVKNACWADFAWLLMREEDGSLAVKACTDEGMFRMGQAAYSSQEADRTPEGRCMESGESLQLSGQLLAGTRKLSLHRSLEKYTANVCVPVHVGNTVLGALGFYYTGDITPSEDEVHYLYTVGSMIGLAIERARLHDSLDDKRDGRD